MVASARTAEQPVLPKARQGEPLAYRGFSRRLAGSIAGLGGALAIPGALGAWIRTSTGDDAVVPDAATAFSGASVESGWLLAIFGAAVLIASIAWPRRRIPVQALLIPAFALTAIAALRLVLLNARTADLVREAAARPEVTTFEATFGWGAWFLLAAGVATFLGGVAAILRELDERRGFAR